MPLFFLGTREWRNRQTRTVQVRVPVMEWGFNSPLAHDETADPFGICGFCFPWLMLVAPMMFRAPHVLCEAGLLDAPVGGGPPASRPRRELRSARRLEARPGPATAHGRRSLAPPRSLPVPSWLSGPSAPVGPGVLTCACALPRSSARPCRRPRVPRPGPPVPHMVASSVVVGVLRHAKPSGGVSPACRSFGWRHSPVLRL